MKVEELKKKIKECKEFDRSFLKAELKGHLDERAEIKKKLIEMLNDDKWILADNEEILDFIKELFEDVIGGKE